MLNEMKYVYAVYQNRSFSKAARQLFITQPALSSMVRKAEKEIGYPVFDRSTVPLTVTKEGEFYIQGIEQILSIQKNMQDHFEDLANLEGGTLSIGGSSYFCSYFLSDLIGKFKGEHPGVSIDLQEGNIGDLKEGLRRDKLDLIIETALNKEDEHITKFLIGYENIILCVPAAFAVNDRLQRYQLSFEDVKSGKYLNNDVPAVPLGAFRDVAFLLMKKGNDMYERSMEMCHAAGFTPKAAMMLDQILTSFYIARSGVGAVFMRAEIYRYLPPSNQLRYYKLGDVLATRPIYMACKKGTCMSHAMREFLLLAGAKAGELREYK